MDHDSDKKPDQIEGPQGNQRPAKSRHVQSSASSDTHSSVGEESPSIGSDAWGQQQLSDLHTHLRLPGHGDQSSQLSRRQSPTDDQDSIIGEASKSVRTSGQKFQPREIGMLTEDKVDNHESFWEAEYQLNPPSANVSKWHRKAVEKEARKHIKQKEAAVPSTVGHKSPASSREGSLAEGGGNSGGLSVRGSTSASGEQQEGERSKRKASQIESPELGAPSKRLRIDQEGDSESSGKTDDKIEEEVTEEKKKPKEASLKQMLGKAEKYKEALNRDVKMRKQMGEERYTQYQILEAPMRKQMGEERYTQYQNQKAQMQEKMGEERYTQYQNQKAQMRESLGEDRYIQYMDQRLSIHLDLNRSIEAATRTLADQHQQERQQIPQIIRQRFQQDIQNVPHRHNQLRQEINEIEKRFQEKNQLILQNTPEELRPQCDQELQREYTNARGLLIWQFVTNFYETQLREQFQQRRAIRIRELEQHSQQRYTRLSNEIRSTQAKASSESNRKENDIEE